MVSSTQATGRLDTGNINVNNLLHKPLKYAGSLDSFKSFDVTPVIGREFPDVQLTDLMKSESSDALLRDLAITSIFFFSSN